MNYNKQKMGYLEIILGPMYSGKTSRLLDIYKQYKFCNGEILVINYIEDTRYSDTMLSTHDKKMIPCIQVKDLSSIHEELYKNTDVILINEGQFFSDLYPFVKKLVDIEKKNVYVCGLDGDFKRQKFGTILDLIPICDKVIKIKSLCGICKNGKKGIFTHRNSNEVEQKIIGSENYIPLCRECYLNKS
jgi:thymidine kinase